MSYENDLRNWKNVVVMQRVTKVHLDFIIPTVKWYCFEIGHLSRRDRNTYIGRLAQTNPMVVVQKAGRGHGPRVYIPEPGT